MSQHDHDLANQLFPNFRGDANLALKAIQTKNSGDSAPGVTFPFMWWVDTSLGTDESEWKVRNESDGSWVTFGTLDNTIWTPYFQGTPLGTASTKAVGTGTGQLAPAESTVLKSGGDMTGALKLSGNPTDPLHAAPKQYVDSVTGVPTGGIIAFGGAVAPAGWLLCDGSAVSRATYATLFSVIGTGYGTGDGINTFNLPDGRDKNLVGKSGTKALGTSGGAASITTVPPHNHAIDIDTGSFGDHTHTFTTGVESQSHVHAYAGAQTHPTGFATGANTGAQVTATNTGSNNVNHTHSGTTNLSSIGNHFHDVIGNTNSTGSNIAVGAVSIQNPYVTANFIIKI